MVWAVALLAHAACKSFGALVACRIVLGMCEGALLLKCTAFSTF